MRYLITLFASLTLAACATNMNRQDTPDRVPVDSLELAEPTDRVYLPLLDNWKRVDRQHIIVYENRNKPYLVRLKRPVTSPFYDDFAIGVRTTNNYLTTFDYVLIDGWRHYIESIRPLTPEQARMLS